MDILKMLFPFSFGVKDSNELVIKILLYVAALVVAGIVIGLLSQIPVVGFVFAILGSIIGLYGLGGIALAVLDYLKILEPKQ